MKTVSIMLAAVITAVALSACSQKTSEPEQQKTNVIVLTSTPMPAVSVSTSVEKASECLAVKQPAIVPTFEAFSKIKDVAFQRFLACKDAAFQEYMKFEREELRKLRTDNFDDYIKWVDDEKMGLYDATHNQKPSIKEFRKVTSDRYQVFKKAEDGYYEAFKKVEDEAYQAYKAQKK